MVSIRDVAREAGVAISTVSKVLNHYPNVREETKEKVNAAIAELGFVPNTIAAALSSKKTGRIALVLDVNRHAQTVDEIPMQYIIGAINRAKEKGMDIITVFFTMIAEMSVDEMVRYFQSQSIEGLIICGLSKDDIMLRRLVDGGKFKCVLIDAPGVDENTSSIHVDNERAQYEVAKKFLEGKPYKKILYLSGKKNGYVSEERLIGVNRLAQELGLSVLVRTGNFSELEARKLTMQYAAGKDAIICASDLMAIGAMKALIDMDIYRPVCGFDGVSLMGYAGKQMHTVRQDFQKIAASAVEELSRLMEGGSGQDIVVPHKLIRIKYLDVIS
ncbi:MAG: LacI family transcriptional regulator [Lachnospiraceae bacterium]|nr:LacI family transcriptional regulator [Lachnospiraceae bacterium]MDE6998713.1 LacI family transcriptional regulator [Lachnospiraceae bacterium]